GNVSSASTPMPEEGGRSWLARLAEEVIGVLRTAYAQGPDSSLAGIEVSASNEGEVASTTTDAKGRFEIPGAPAGDLTITFQRADCDASAPVSAVVDGSHVTLQDVSFECGFAAPESVSEQFTGIVESKSTLPEESVAVCVETGDERRTRRVDVREAEIRNRDGDAVSFDDLREGDEILASGQRSGQGDSPALDAKDVQILRSHRRDACAVAATPTPGAEPTATPTAGEASPSPTAGEPGPTETPATPTPTTSDGEPTATPAPSKPTATPAASEPMPTPGDPLSFLPIFPTETPPPDGGEETPTPEAGETPTPGTEETPTPETEGTATPESTPATPTETPEF
ncbi:MAG: carboxypeptidase regulatory-like domain-containing protein, partial [Candidatus Binatia bacterium]